MVGVPFIFHEGTYMADEVETFLGKCPLKRNGILSIRQRKRTPEEQREADEWHRKAIFYEQLMDHRKRLAKVEREIVEVQRSLFEMAEMFEAEIPPDELEIEDK